ncbi:MAG TPA: class I SAM-dependent methyltransferase [Acidimicrobiales bacterium]|nr:class I SAM-dependent methyltransferase [Acidimicrobiales bacterium]
MAAAGSPRSVARSWRLLRAFRLEQRDPDTFYDLLSADAVALLGRAVRLSGAVALDVGGGAGYLTRALRDVGARCVLVDADAGELSWRGPPAAGSVVADARALPVPSGAVDVVVSSNVLEHVSGPLAVVDEMARVLRPGGFLWLSFTNWYGPWGGHETSPWHYLGGHLAKRRYAARTGRDPKNVFGESLFPLHVGGMLRRLSRHPLLEVVDARPRYLPEAARGLVRVPVLREVVTWNLEILARRRTAAR